VTVPVMGSWLRDMPTELSVLESQPQATVPEE
jgi:hypothetical protein